MTRDHAASSAARAETTERLRRAILVADMIAFAKRRLAADGVPEPSMRKAVWWLLREAAKTDRNVRIKGAQGAVTGSLPYIHTREEIAETEREIEADRITHGFRIREQVSADAMSRWLEVGSWYRFIRAHDRDERRALVYAMASGLKASDAAGPRFGVQTAKAAHMARERAVDNIVEGVERILEGQP